MPAPRPPDPVTPPVTPRSFTFAGLEAKRAQRIVYVLDASGPMVSHWPWVKEQLRLSLSRLEKTQEFQVLITRLLPATDAQPIRTPEVLASSPADNDSPVRSSAVAVADAIVWLSRQKVRGASDPLPGLSRALSLRPDLVLLLSHGFAQGHEANEGRSAQAVLAELDRLNPRVNNGRRAVVIKTIQLGNDDAAGLLQAIAQEHGDGPGSFHIVAPSDLEQRDRAK
jgi:hypothetical protein